MGYVDNSSVDGPIRFAMVSVIGIALYNVIELNFIVFSIFKRKSGLYFWSFFVATWGIFFHTISYLLWNLGVLKNAVAWVTIAVVGWVPMVTGQSLVLYSRLHLIMYDRRILRLVLAMIITNVFIGHVPTIIVAYGAILAPEPGTYATSYSVYEKIQVSLFFIQEVIISGLYIWYSYKTLQMQEALHGAQASRMLYHLVVVNILVLVLDITVLVLEYNNLYSLQTAIKGMVYSIKLKIEYSILNSLVNVAKANIGQRSEHDAVLNIDSQRRYRYGTGSRNSGERASRRQESVAVLNNSHTGGQREVFAQANNIDIQPDDGIVVMTSAEVAYNKPGDRECESIVTRPSLNQRRCFEGMGTVPSASSQDGFATKGF
ncbi:hypothetical protein FALCPG4_015199 [Fusarium falciforme]